MRIILLLAFLLSYTLAYSCSCSGSRAFCANIKAEYSNIVLIKKIRDIAHGMEVEVIDSYASGIEDDKIIIWGDTGILCRMYTSSFEIGKTYILNIYRLEEDRLATVHEKEGDFVISFCGTHALLVNGDKVEGYISDTENVESMSLEEFGRNIINFSCAGALKIRVTPNPFWGEIQIQSNDVFNEIEMYDMSGKLVYHHKLNAFQETHVLEFDKVDLAAGAYVLKLYASLERTASIKLIKL